MNAKNLNQILLLLTYFATQHGVINAMKRSITQINNTQQHKQPIPALKKTKLNNKTAALLCTLCNKTFSTNSNLSAHKKNHTGEKPYTCDICHKSFATNNNLSIHKKIHTGEKPYTCDICHKTFYQNEHLIAHQRIHTGEKPYKCNMCDKTFAHTSNRAKHQRTHTGKKSYSCNICLKSFSQLSHLATHQKIHAKIITPTINLVKNNTKKMPTQITENISLKSFNTPTDSQDILENITSINDADFDDWMKK